MTTRRVRAAEIPSECVATRFYWNDPAAPEPNAPPSLGAIAVLLHEGRLLLERRSDTGEWGLVGGAIEPGESVAQALFREIREETGLVLPARDGRAAVTDFALFGVYSDPTRIAAYADGTVRRIVSVAFKMDVADLSALRASDESLEIRLFARSELEAITIVATHREVVLDYLSGTSAPFIR